MLLKRIVELEFLVGLQAFFLHPMFWEMSSHVSYQLATFSRHVGFIARPILRAMFLRLLLVAFLLMNFSPAGFNRSFDLCSCLYVSVSSRDCNTKNRGEPKFDTKEQRTEDCPGTI